MIQQRLHQALLEAVSMEEVQSIALSVLADVRKETDRLGYVVGIISSDGPDKIPENIQKLISATENIRAEQDFPVFSSQDIFSKELYEKLKLTNVTENDFRSLWSNVLESGYVTDVFFTPRWEESIGAKEEYEIAKRLGLHCFFL